MTLLQRLENLESQLEDLRHTGRSQFEDKLILTRATTLDEWSSQKRENQVDTNRRNLFAHGGRIVTGIETIRIYSKVSNKSDRMEKWRQEFNRRYGVSYEEISSVVRTVPENLLTLLDRRASILSMRIWATPHHTKIRDQIVGKANVIIRAWRAHQEDLFAEKSLNAELRSQIEKDWYNVYDGQM